MAKETPTPNVIMYLKHMNDDLYYCMNDRNGKYEPLEEDSVTGVDANWIVQWECADDSITKINNINVNENKGGGRNRGNIWAKKPKKANSSGTIFQGTVFAETPNPPMFDGYTIKYKTADGDKEKDPEMRIPQP
jgi:hypothetical protein